MPIGGRVAGRVELALFVTLFTYEIDSFRFRSTYLSFSHPSWWYLNARCNFSKERVSFTHSGGLKAKKTYQHHAMKEASRAI